MLESKNHTPMKPLQVITYNLMLNVLSILQYIYVCSLY